MVTRPTGAPDKAGRGASPALVVEGLTCGYNGRPIVRNVDLAVAPGECVALIGPNGAGKTTLLRAVSGLLPPQRGRVLIEGRDVHRLGPRERAQQMAVVAQQEGTVFRFSVRDLVAMGRTPYLKPLRTMTAADREAIETALEATQVQRLAERDVTTLSGGERQRVLLARALAQEPRLLLLDEPTANLDINYQLELLRQVTGLVQQSRVAVLMVLHDLNLASLFADRMVLIEAGEVVVTGRPEDVVTPDHVRRVFGVDVRVDIDPQSGRPRVFPSVSR